MVKEQRNCARIEKTENGRKVKEFTFQRNLKPIGECVGEARGKDDRSEVISRSCRCCDDRSAFY